MRNMKSEEMSSVGRSGDSDADLILHHNKQEIKHHLTPTKSIKSMNQGFKSSLSSSPSFLVKTFFFLLLPLNSL